MQDEILAGKTAIVTGSSRGIGRAIAERFAAEGADLVVCSRSIDDIEPVADELTDSYSGRTVGVRCDVTDEGDVRDLVDTAIEEFGGVDSLVNNAGGSIADDNVHRLDLDTWEANVDANFKSHFLVTREVLPLMIEGGGGSMVHMSSVNGVTGIGLTAYSMARSGLFNFSRLVATQYGRHGIRSNVIAPATIETEQRGDEMDETGSAQETDDGEWTQRDQWYDQYPLGRFGDPEEVADATLFLASEMASFVTGETLLIDGGLAAGLDWSFQTQIYESDEVPERGQWDGDE